MNASTVTEVTEYWASMVATFLEDVRKAYDGGARKDRAIAVAKLGQVGSLMSEYFVKEVTRLCTVAGVTDPDTFIAANKATKVVIEFHNRKIDKVGRVDNLVDEKVVLKQELKDLN